MYASYWRSLCVHWLSMTCDHLNHNVCPGHRGLRFPLLGLVWRPRWLRRRSGCLAPPATPHRLPAAGRHWCPSQHGLAPTDHPGRGIWGLPLSPGQHSRTPAFAYPGILAARCLWHAGLAQQHAATTPLLHREESGTREPGGGGHRECLQGNGEVKCFWVNRVGICDMVAVGWFTMKGCNLKEGIFEKNRKDGLVHASA